MLLIELPPPEPTIDPNGYCPTGWIEWRGSCYKFDTSRSAMTWDSAQYTCQTDFGSSLASVVDSEENLFIMHYALDTWGAGNIWIGLRRNEYGKFFFFVVVFFT